MTSLQNLFVAKLPRNLTDADLEQVFADYKPLSAKIMLDPATGKSKGFGFVLFSSEDEGRVAYEALNKTHVSVLGHSFNLCIFPSKHDGKVALECSNSLYVRNIPHTQTQADVEAFLRQFGNLVYCAMREDHFGEPVWVVYAEYETVDEARAALAKLHNNRTFFKNSAVPILAKHADSDETKKERRKRREMLHGGAHAGGNGSADAHTPGPQVMPGDTAAAVAGGDGVPQPLQPFGGAIPSHQHHHHQVPGTRAEPYAPAPPQHMGMGMGGDYNANLYAPVKTYETTSPLAPPRYGNGTVNASNNNNNNNNNSETLDSAHGSCASIPADFLNVRKSSVNGDSFRSSNCAPLNFTFEAASDAGAIDAQQPTPTSERSYRHNPYAPVSSNNSSAGPSTPHTLSVEPNVTTHYGAQNRFSSLHSRSGSDQLSPNTLASGWTGYNNHYSSHAGNNGYLAPPASTRTGGFFSE